MADFDLKAYLEQRRLIVEADLERRLPKLPPEIDRLGRAMGHCLYAGGKRLRPILCLAGAELCGGDPKTVLPAASAMEMIHTYSLIHDDLPAMDDDDLRRGKPTCHVAFDEATAVLAGDGLLTEAFAVLIELLEDHPAERVTAVVKLFADAAGPRGMVGGQMADMLAEGRDNYTVDEVAFIHRLKTGCLLTASILSGATLAGAGETELAAVESYGRNIGAAFQIVDDLLDIVSDTETLGKPVGSDRDQGKATYPAAIGLEGAKDEALRLIDQAKRDLEPFGAAAEPLRALADYIEQRSR